MGIRPCAPVTKPPPTGKAEQCTASTSEQMKADARPGDIHDGIDGTHLVEVDLVHRGPVHAGLGLGQPREDARRLRLHPGIEAARRDQRQNRLQVPVRMLVTP
jgi:hypothetical protein